MNELISIILPVYNGEQFLAEAIESCLNQSYQNIELIIVNDCSTDKSLEIANHYSNKDHRIKIITNNTNKNLPVSLNIGHSMASGEFLTWTSDDNIMKYNMLEVLISQIKTTNADLVFSNYDVIEADGSFRRLHNFGPVNSLIFGSCIGASFLYKRKVFLDLGGYDEKLHTIEDYDFWLRAAIKYKFYHLNKSLYQYRVHPNNLTADLQASPELKELFEKKHKLVYEKLSASLAWSDSTKEFLLMLRGFDIWDWEFFRDNYMLIVTDLKKFQSLIQANDKRNVLKAMDWNLRHKVLNTATKKSIYRWLCLKRPGVFFDPYYSKKTSLKMVKKYFD